MSEGKIIITGTGRAGTSSLVKLLTHLGYDTGYTTSDDVHPETRGGLEICFSCSGNGQEMRETLAGLPRIIKSPELTGYLKAFAARKIMDIDWLIVPVRDVPQSARSRVDVGLHWNAKDYETQVATHYQMLGAVVEAAVLHKIPTVFMRYPDFCVDAAYCFDRLERVFPDLDNETFADTFGEVMNRTADAIIA